MPGFALLTQGIEESAKQTLLTIQKDKNNFVSREEQRLRFLEDDKLASMKAVMAYEKQVREFPELSADLMGEIQASKNAN